MKARTITIGTLTLLTLSSVACTTNKTVHRRSTVDTTTVVEERVVHDGPATVSPKDGDRRQTTTTESRVIEQRPTEP